MGSERRKALPFKAKMPDITNISRLLIELPTCFRVTLQGKFGQILDLVSVDVQTPAITALAQFYDPPLRRKTPYNRIGQVPEVENLALALYIPISDALANWKKRENLFGFWRAYLEEEAESEMSNGDWARTLVYLSSKDILWYRHKLNVEEIIVSCGSFLNVPLIGSKGCIMLALRQFGYPMRGKPGDKELEEMVLNDMGTNDPFLLRKIIRSWEKVHTKGTELVKKNGAARVPYQQ
ncbi:hypothetical protein KIW84_057794 [Lathyrus oleraceus]|uniref:DUF7745 domain-containing protein n=1 Tax=Pisum sativum TaxID=3888 RepID=A0A9D4X5E9_PEA|nr:hypothetical protein KIW84_057794 [Pisum sativum]